MTTKKSELPRGWDQERVDAVIEHYEKQTDTEAAAEHEAALSHPDSPPAVRPLTAEHKRKNR